MRYFVTGGSGFIGHHFVRQALDKGYSVLNYDKLTYAGDNARLKDCKIDENYSFIKGDICNIEDLKKAINNFKPDVIVNFAAESHVDRSIDSPSVFIDTNVNGTANLVQCALDFYQNIDPEYKKDFRYVQISTDEVYGDLSESDPAFSKDMPYKPSSPYSASKASADHIVRAWHHTYGLPTLITNCSNNYGPGQHPEKLIPHMILSAISGKKLPIYGTGENIRDWIYVTEHNDAVFEVINKGQIGETYLIGGNSERKNIEIVRELCSILDKTLPSKDHSSYQEQIEFVADRPGHDRRYAIDTEDIEKEIGWSPHITIDEGLLKTVEWYLNNIEWVESLSDKYEFKRIGLG